MSKVAIPVFETTLQKTHCWLKDLTTLMGWDDEHLSYSALKATLHALRDRLPVEIVAKLGAQLPLLIRGIYYEGWVPAHTPLKIHRLEDFLELVASYLNNDKLLPEVPLIAANVFRVMRNHLSEGEIDHIKKVLPAPIASLLSLL